MTVIFSFKNYHLVIAWYVPCTVDASSVVWDFLIYKPLGVSITDFSRGPTQADIALCLSFREIHAHRLKNTR